MFDRKEEEEYAYGIIVGQVGNEFRVIVSEEFRE